MRKRVVTITILLALFVALALPTAAMAGQNGCPNANAENGASHANANHDNSAHGSDQRGAPGCEKPE